jgi:cytochrome c oxidase subunit IV
MSTAPAVTDSHSTDPHGSAPVHMPMFDAHDKQYLLIALGLGCLTAIEVALSYSGLKHASLALLLMSLAAIKFIVVAGYFMHLKNDSPLFRRLFIIGAVLAGFCYSAVLYAFGRFEGPTYWLIFVAFAVVIVFVWALTGVNRDLSVFNEHNLESGDPAHAH